MNYLIEVYENRDNLRNNKNGGKGNKSPIKENIE